MPKTRWYHSAETSTSVTFATRSLRELTLMGIMYRQMNRGFVTKIIEGNAQVYLKLLDRNVPAGMRQKHDGSMVLNSNFN